MDFETLFSFASALAMAGWLALLASPWFPRAGGAIGGLAIPMLLCALYGGLVLAFWGGGPEGAGFGSLDAVDALLSTPGMLLAGWVHYLAFDLFVGGWEVRVARRDGIPFWTVVPCLFATLMFGPAGLLLFLVLRLATRPAAGLPFVKETTP